LTGIEPAIQYGVMAFCRLFNSTLFLKYMAAISGAALFGFTIIHMLGNLQAFQSPEKINAYAYMLQSNLVVLWGFRLGLLAMVLLHLYSVITLTIRNRAARPQGYLEKKALGATLASRSMAVSGTILLAFIIFHLLHFTVQAVYPEYKTLETTIPHVDGPVHDVHAMIVEGFRNPVITGFYILSMALLCLHLSHGVQSMFRSLGLSGGAWAVGQLWGARIFAAVLFVGFASVPAAVYIGIIGH
jgi:succinate dehydrogenase / fumarate reductase, cytochrome b subunit